jgi:PIN domain nuclease of toxin-antitoxin system
VLLLAASSQQEPSAIREDPFDRILIAQEKVEGIILLTAYPVITRPPG